MLKEIRALKRLTTSVAASDVLDLLEREVTRRVAFERAMVQYLEDSPAAPFAAADAFKKWLQFDIDNEA